MKFREVAHFYIGCQMNNGLILHSVDDDGKWFLFDKVNIKFHEYFPTRNDSIKPLLYQLSDMDRKQFYDSGLVTHPIHWASSVTTYKFKVETMAYLLKKGFDIFGLIDSREAEVMVKKQLK